MFASFPRCTERRQMGIVVQMRRKLTSPPVVPVVAGLRIRHYGGPADIQRWLQLRAQSFAGQLPAVRPWTDRDFESEFLAKPWWRSSQMWFADAEGARESVGSIALALRSGKPAIHWLMVLPEWRRLGVGCLLLAELEQLCWRKGMRKVLLETHDNWLAALSFYEKRGYERVN